MIINQHTFKPVSGLLTITMLAIMPLSAMADGQASFAKEKGWAPPVSDSPHGLFFIDRLEYAAGDDEDSVNLEFKGWYGGDYNRIWVEGEAEDVVSGGSGGAIENLDLLYGRLISPYWSVQAGVGYQLEYGPGPDPDRAYAVLGLQGLAPYWFEIDTNLRVSEDGDAWADFETEYDFRLTQKLVLQPRFGTMIAFDEVEEFGVGQGINHVKLGLRLRYEIKREFAPYVGVSWNRKLGDTADLVRAEGGDPSDLRLLGGVRMWF
ncbi:copper resistance protein B [Guyparkeria sp. 1SP6A2]|nr:copper resistance protein B [Guyparkeria sp. 1SP6A2]